MATKRRFQQVLASRFPPFWESRLSAHRQALLFQGIWLLLACVCLTHILFSLPVMASQLCSPQGCISLLQRSTPQPFGFSAYGLNLYFVALGVLIFLANFAMSLLILLRASQDRVARYTAFTLVLFGSTVIAKSDALTQQWPLWSGLMLLVSFTGQLLFIFLLYLFPDGHFVPFWTRFPALLSIPLLGSLYFFPESAFSHWLILLTPLWILGLLGSGVFAQVYRYRYVSDNTQRQQTKWMVFGLTLFVLVYIGVSMILMLFAQQEILATLIGDAVMALALLCLPGALGIATLRYRLWEIDLLINRALVYGVLSACVVGFYVLFVGTAALFFQSSNNLLVSLLATGLVALLFQPLRSYVQRAVNRLMYGERDEPAVALARLGRRLEGALQPDALLAAIVETVAQALKLPYAAIHVLDGGELVPKAVYGTLASVGSDNLLHLALLARNEQIGEIVLAPRSPWEVLSQRDQKLLREFASQAGLAVHAALLTEDLWRANIDLQHSRERLVLTREEERRRIRRDLHDGLAPTLAALALTASTVEELIPRNPALASTMAHELQEGIRTTIGDIRRLVYDLRPPTLDQLGLVAAMQEHITRSTPADPNKALKVTLKTPPALPPLPAAIEVAIYRITQEAFANVLRHAQARNCHICLTLSDTLRLEIIDDGRGVPPEHHTGVGLLSMRERATELGGSCLIETPPTGGTRLCASLPLVKEI